MSREYADLNARPVSHRPFRPERQLALSFLRDCATSVEVQGRTWPVHDLAMNGVSFMARPDTCTLKRGDQEHARVCIGGDTAYEGQVRVVRVEPAFQKERVALQLLDNFLDLPMLQSRARDRELDRALALGPEHSRDLVPAPVREAVEEITHFLAWYKRLLDEHEARQREANPASPEIRLQLAQRGADSMRERWNRLRVAASRATALHAAHKDIREATKRYVEDMVGPLARPAPLYLQSYTKPLGYPGDYRAMLYIYGNRYEGDTAYGAALHKLSCEEPLAHGVRTRKDLLVQIHEEEVRRHFSTPHPDTFRVTSLACGPAREVTEFLQSVPTRAADMEWSLVDQEQEALSLAWHEIHRAVATTGARARARCLYLSFAQMLKEPDTLALDQPQDLIYAAGLFDYLPPYAAAGLVRGLYGRLRPGGLLAIGNATRENHNFFLEYVCDWTLLYRSPEEMLRLAEGLDAAHVEVRPEPTRTYHFLLVRRP